MEWVELSMGSNMNKENVIRSGDIVGKSYAEETSKKGAHKCENKYLI